MITYEPPEQEEVNVGDHIEGIGTVMEPDDFKVAEPPQRLVAEGNRGGRSMTATDELCRMLDERGVEHEDEKDGKFLLVTWSYNKTSATFVEDTVSGETSIAISAIVTPEQAVEATLGRGTCKAVYNPNGVYCSVCHGGGLTIPRHGVNALRNYCPNCGRKVDGRKVVDA